MLKKNDLQPDDAPPTSAETIVGAGVVILILVCIVLNAWPAARHLLWTEVAAAWVQAIGSVVAICTAIWLAHNQAEVERKKKAVEETERRVRNTSMALAAVSYIRFVSEGIEKDLIQTGETDELPARTEMLARRIEALRSFAERLDLAQLDNALIAPRYFGVLAAVVALDAAYLQSPQRAQKTIFGVIEICNRFHSDFGDAGVHAVREYMYLPEFQHP